MNITKPKNVYDIKAMVEWADSVLAKYPPEKIKGFIRYLTIIQESNSDLSVVHLAKSYFQNYDVMSDELCDIILSHKINYYSKNHYVSIHTYRPIRFIYNSIYDKNCSNEWACNTVRKMIGGEIPVSIIEIGKDAVDVSDLLRYELSCMRGYPMALLDGEMKQFDQLRKNARRKYRNLEPHQKY